MQVLFRIAKGIGTVQKLHDTRKTRYPRHRTPLGTAQSMGPVRLADKSRLEVQYLTLEEGHYSIRVWPGGRSVKLREQNQIADLDRLRIMDKLCQRGGSWTLDSLNKYVTEQNGLRPRHWAFYPVIRQMEEDCLLIAKYDPEWKQTMVKATDYGRQQYIRLREQLGEILGHECQPLRE